MMVPEKTYVFEVVPVVPVQTGETGTALPPRLRLVVKEEATTPVTALANLNGYVVQAMGQKVDRPCFPDWARTDLQDSAGLCPRL